MDVEARSKEAPMSGAELLVDSLVAEGISVVFGLPGDTGIIFYDELAQRRSQIRHVLVRDERHASYMADGYARSTGNLAACEASSGAGAVYLASGLAESYASSIPVLVVTTDINQRSRGSGAITEIDQVALFSAVSKWTVLVENADQIPDAVHSAVAMAVSGRPGPTVVIVPEDVLEQTVEEVILTPIQTGHPVEFAYDSQIADAANVLLGADRPVILAGGGTHHSKAWADLASLASDAGIPVATTIHGKGAIADDHPMALGVAGANGSRGYANDFLSSADAVLIVGSRANSTDTNGYTAPGRSAAKIVQIDRDAGRAGRNFPGSLPVVGDASDALRRIRTALPVVSAEQFRATSESVESARQKWRTGLDSSSHLPPGWLAPTAVVQTLNRVLGKSCTVVGDPGTPTPHLSAFWETEADRRRVIIPRGHGPMGFAIAAAIGVAVARPDEPVLCLTTEGSLAMGVADWETAGRLSLPILFVVLDNVSFAWIKMLQHLYLDRRYFGVDPGGIDPVRLAEGMGLDARRAHDLGELELFATEFLSSSGPSVVHVRIPEHIEAPPPVAPWESALNGGAKVRPVY